jgi:hypothetical protein
VCFRDPCEPIGLRNSSLRPVVVSQFRIPVEEEQVRVQELTIVAKDPHEYLHREDIDQETSVRPHPGHSFPIISPPGRGAANNKDYGIVVDVSSCNFAPNIRNQKLLRP